MQNHIPHSSQISLLVNTTEIKGLNILQLFQNNRGTHLGGPQISLFAGWSLVFPSEEETSVFQGQPELCHYLVTETTHKLGLLCYSNKKLNFFNLSFQPAVLNVVNSLISRPLCSTLLRVANIQSSTKAST